MNTQVNYAAIDFNKDAIYSPLRHHRLGLMETSTGCGSKLRTPYKVPYKGRVRRVYAICYGNAATMYIVYKGQRLVIDY
mgnify:CR=1 FL=1